MKLFEILIIYYLQHYENGGILIGVLFDWSNP